MFKTTENRPVEITTWEEADIIAAARDIFWSKRAREINPHGQTESGEKTSCYNTDPDDPERHCLAATIMIDLGLTGEILRPGSGYSVHGLLSLSRDSLVRFNSNATDLLNELQNVADAPGDDPLPWGIAIARVFSGNRIPLEPDA